MYPRNRNSDPTEMSQIMLEFDAVMVKQGPRSSANEYIPLIYFIDVVASVISRDCNQCKLLTHLQSLVTRVLKMLILYNTTYRFEFLNCTTKKRIFSAVAHT